MGPFHDVPASPGTGAADRPCRSLRRAPVRWLILGAALQATAGPGAAQVEGSEQDFFDVFAGAVATGVPRPDLPQTPALTPLSRVSEPDYADGFGAPAGPGRPSPRALSNALSVPANAREDRVPLTNLAVAMFQLLASHTHARSPTLAGPDERITIPLAPDDPLAAGDPAAAITLQRSAHAGGTGPGDPREQLNDVTPSMDGSSVYGSDAATEELLRRLDGTGRMKTGPDGGLPIIDGRPAAGDVRRDENRVLEGVHALFVREHNRLADGIADGCARTGASCSGDEIFAGARRLVTLQQQKILYDELLPTLLGTDDLASLAPAHLQDHVSGALNEYTAAAGRIGHTQVPDTILLAKPDGSRRSVPLADCFFDTGCLGDAPLEDLLLGAALQPAEAVDTVVEDSLRNALVPGFGQTLRTDLYTLNIARGRDHGLADYMSVRAALGLPERPLEDLLPEAIRSAYDDPEATGIDLLVGMFGEDLLPGAYLGETAAALWALQFEALSREPGFFATDDLAPGVPDWLDDVSMSRLLSSASGLSPDQLPADPFRVTPAPAAVPLSPTLPLLAAGVGALVLARRRRAAVPGRARQAPPRFPD